MRAKNIYLYIPFCGCCKFVHFKLKTTVSPIFLIDSSIQTNRKKQAFGLNDPKEGKILGTYMSFGYGALTDLSARVAMHHDAYMCTKSRSIQRRSPVLYKTSILHMPVRGIRSRMNQDSQLNSLTPSIWLGKFLNDLIS